MKRLRILLVCAVLAATLSVWISVPAAAFERTMSLLTKQQIGELAVAGRLSIDLHAEFMVSRTYDKDTVLNWYNCGYSGGSSNGTTKVGGDFGDFGFQVPFNQREEKYPHAVELDKVPAVRFDGGDFLKGNFPVENSIAGPQKMAVEIWLRSENPSKDDVILGWQSRDGKETSAAIKYPEGFKGSGDWQHIVVNCTPDKEDWYLNGARVSSGARHTIIKEGEVMVLGGESSAKPSFKGDLVAVRLHDDAMTEEQIDHNFKGGVMLGTEMHNWWRTEPDKWYVVESEHFRQAIDKEDMKKWSDKQLKDFNDRVPGMFNLAELVYHTYTEREALRSSVVSRQPQMRGDGIKYKIPIQPAQGSWMGVDDNFGWCCQGEGFINPHELIHGFDAQTGGMQGSFWETHANFPQTYNGIYQTIPIVAAECSAFPSSGRTYYHDRLMFEYLAQTPEYGPMFISKLWYDGPTEKDAQPYPWIAFNRINPYPQFTLADEYTKMAMRNVTYDYVTYVDAQGKPGNTPWGNDGVVSTVNRYRQAAEGSKADIQRWQRIVLQKIPYSPEWWRVPKEQAPQQLGWNICPLKATAGKVTATLEGYVDPKRGSDWRAAFVGVDAGGKPVYGEVFGPKKPQSFDVKSDIKELYLVVCATPTNMIAIDMVGDFRSFEQEQFPYKVKFAGCEPLDVMTMAKPTASGAPHANGDGFVASTAKVNATAYVGPNAQVLGNSQVLGNARIGDYAVVQNATVKDNAVVGGHALVTDGSTIAEHAKIRDYAVVRGQTTVQGNARILEHAAISTKKTCSDNVTVKGVANVYGGSQSGTAMIDGFYAKGNEITKGKWFTWSWGQGKNPGEIDEDFGGLYADYDFEDGHPWMAHDAFGATWGYLVGAPKYQAVPERKSQAIVLNGKNQFIELPKDVADMRNCTYTVDFKWDGGGGARIFEFGNPGGDAMWLSPSEKGKLIFAIRKGNVVEQVSAPAVKKGVWMTVRVVVGGSRAILFVDGKMAADNAKMTLAPDSVRATECYLGRGLKGGYFGGMIDRFTIHSVAVVDAVP